ncbi:MAG TPA: polyprenyl diphosphate synthase [Paracoccaceae bacterium]|nr:polyprenyl diphosphate synthase [Paracoccaceae bacterium]
MSFEDSQHSDQQARHVAIIMDGNGRWAKARGLPRLAGHRAGAKTVSTILESCPDLGVEHLTLFAFSTENWKRSVEEVEGLMALFRRYMRKQAADLVRDGVCVRFIGERSRLDRDIQDMMASIEESSAHNTRLFLTVALNYGGRDELARATRKIAEAVAAGTLDPATINEASVAAALDTYGTPDPDLVIRTSGEYRISNFLLWQTAYSEFAFTKTLWPDFTVDEFKSMLTGYKGRVRRFGAVK